MVETDVVECYKTKKGKKMELREIITEVHKMSAEANWFLAQDKPDEAGNEIEKIRDMLNVEHEQNEE